MPKAIDEEKFSELKTLDINNPPTANIPYEAYPKMVYLHPKDKTKEHLYKVVNTPEEHEAAEDEGWKTKPHNPVPVVVDLSEHFDAEPQVKPLESMSKAALIAEAKKRGIDVNPQDKKEVILAAITDASDAA